MTLMDDSKENEAEDEAIVFGESKGMSEFDVQLAARACVYPQISRVPLIQLSILQNVVTHLTFMPLWYTSSNLNFRCCFPNFSTSVSTWRYKLLLQHSRNAQLSTVQSRSTTLLLLHFMPPVISLVQVACSASKFSQHPTFLAISDVTPSLSSLMILGSEWRVWKSGASCFSSLSSIGARSFHACSLSGLFILTNMIQTQACGPWHKNATVTDATLTHLFPFLHMTMRYYMWCTDTSFLARDREYVVLYLDMITWLVMIG